MLIEYVYLHLEMVRTSVIILIFLAIATAILILGMSLEVVYDYQAKLDTLTYGNCTIVAFTPSKQRMVAGKYNSYFYTVRTGERKYIWVTDDYYVIDVQYCITGREQREKEPQYCDYYRDGYFFKADSEAVLNTLSVGQRTVCYHPKDDERDLTVTVEGQLTGPIVGVVFLVILSFIALTTTIIVAGYVFVTCFY